MQLLSPRVQQRTTEGSPVMFHYEQSSNCVFLRNVVGALVTHLLKIHPQILQIEKDLCPGLIDKFLFKKERENTFAVEVNNAPDLADAGFVFDEKKNRVVCFCCENDLCSSSTTWTKHKELYSYCPFNASYTGIMEKATALGFLTSDILISIRSVDNPTVRTVTAKLIQNREVNNERKSRVCAFCQSRLRRIVNLPCMHCYACAECNTNSAICLVCENEVVKCCVLYFK